MSFKSSPNALLVGKVRDIVGLYLHPPTHAAVFCVDENPQIQALNRMQPLLPMRPGQVEQRTHQRHRAVPFREFLDVIDTLRCSVRANSDICHESL